MYIDKRINKKISLGTSHIPLSAIEMITNTLKKGRLSYGPITRNFENKFAKLHKSKYAVFTNSGTDALRLALFALKSIYKWNNGDEVLVPAVTFVATPNIVLQNNLKPRFVDINLQTYNIEPNEIEKHVSKKTRAILPVHLFGLPADMKPILEIAKKYNLKIIEDSAEAMLVNYRGKPVGSFGDLACFSTYMAHLLVTGVGGLVITNNKRYEIKVRSLLNHGRDPAYLNIDADDNVFDKDFTKIVKKRFKFSEIGYSSRLTEMEAALGLFGLRDLRKNILKRQKNAQYLKKGLADLQDFIQLPYTPKKNTEHAYMFFTISIINKKIKRDDLMMFLEKRGIETRYAMPLLNQPVYINMFGDLEKRYPNARFVDHHSFCISCHHELTRKDLDYVIDLFHEYFKKL